MLYKLSKRKYSEIVAFANQIYGVEIELGLTAISKFYDLRTKRVRIDYTFSKYKGNFTVEEQTILKLNLLINDNIAFFQYLSNLYRDYLEVEDMNDAKELSVYKHLGKIVECQKIIDFMIKQYNISDKTALCKITELITFKDIYISNFTNDIFKKEVTKLEDDEISILPPKVAPLETTFESSIKDRRKSLS